VSQDAKSLLSPLPGLSRAQTTALMSVWIALTLPMLTLGFGSDADAWTVARTGERIWESGTYIRSRTSGFPLYELVLAPLVHIGGSVATNALSFVCGLVVIWAWLRLAANGVLRRPALTTCMFAFLPIFIKNSTSTMDYVPALALLLTAYVAWEQQRWTWCAVLIGVACGVRPTSALLIVPAAVAAFVRTKRVPTAAMMVVVAAVVGTAAFWPSLRLGGFGPVRTVTPLQGARTALQLFGVLQAPLLAAGGLFFLDRRRTPWSAFDVFHVTSILVFGLAFAVHPGGTEYLLPIVPSVILLMDRHVSITGAALACAVALSYHVVSIDVEGTRGGMRSAALKWTHGFTMRDIDDRRFKLWLKEAAAHWPGTEPTVLLELQMQPFAADRRWAYDPALNVFRAPGSLLAVATLSDDLTVLGRMRERGFRVVARREREWQYLRAQGLPAHPFVEFVDDLGAVLKTPIRGSPLE